MKPFPLAEVLARVRALLRRTYGKRSPVLNTGDLEVDPLRRSVKRALAVKVRERPDTLEFTPGLSVPDDRKEMTAWMFLEVKAAEKSHGRAGGRERGGGRAFLAPCAAGKLITTEC